MQAKGLSLLFFGLLVGQGCGPMAAAPNDDLFANRTVLFHGNPRPRALMELAGTTLETGDPSVGHPGVTGNAWIEWVAPETGDFNFICSAPSGKASLRVYAGTNLTSLSPQVFQWTGSPEGIQTSTESILVQNNNAFGRFPATEDRVYQIAVENYSGADQNQFSLRITPTLANDDFSGRKVLSGPTRGLRRPESGGP